MGNSATEAVRPAVERSRIISQRAPQKILQDGNENTECACPKQDPGCKLQQRLALHKKQQAHTATHRDESKWIVRHDFVEAANCRDECIQRKHRKL